ncbi:MAG: carbohydrate kinase family protein [Janthinobacterium sp.]|jgi:ribokinase
MKNNSKPKFDLIALGDATLDTFIEIEEATVTCSLLKEDCVLCLSYADKIPVKSLQRKVAGNAANVAVGTSRLGLKSAFWTVLGNDPFANEVIKKMKDEKVSTKYVHKERGTESNFTVVLNYKGERTQLIYRVPRTYHLPKLDAAKFIYLTAMGVNHHQSYEDLIKYVTLNQVKFAYNPGREQIVCKEKICKSLLEYADILFVNKEEAHLILKGYPPKKHKGTEKMRKPVIRELLMGLHDRGPKIVVMTDGENGSYVFASHKFYELPIFPGPLIERTGAGDAYATGFLSAIIHDRKVEEAMAWGTYNAWSVVQKVGPIDGLLKFAQINKLVKKNLFFRGEEI